VCLAHPEPSNATDHRRFFDAPVRFPSGKKMLVVPTSLLDQPCKGDDPGLLRVIDRYAADRLERVPCSESAIDRVRGLPVEENLDGEPTGEPAPGVVQSTEAGGGSARSVSINRSRVVIISAWAAPVAGPENPE